MAGGLVVRCTTEPREIPLDRVGLAALPGQPPPGVPLVCLDTETTGLATATGTVAFLVGLGWWEGDAFHQVQLLLPDHADEPALLTALAGYIPLDGWLVTYNGRGFDWPLLVTRYRMARRAAPIHGGHLDLLPVVRRLFRHRLEDARLRTVESGSARDGPPRRHRRLGDPRALPRVPARRAGRTARRGRPPQRPGRPLARAPPGPARQRLRDARKRDGPRRPATSVAWPARTRGRDGSARPWSATTSPSRLSQRRRRRPLRGRSRCGRSTRGAGRRTGRRGPVVVAARPGRTSAARHGRTSGPRRRSGRRPSPLPGRPTGSPSNAPTCCAACGAGTTRRTPGRAWRPVRAGPPSSPRSSSPSSASIACATRSGRCVRPATASPSPSGGSVSAVRSRDWRPTCAPAPDGCDDVSSGGPRPQPGGPTRRQTRVGGLP